MKSLEQVYRSTEQLAAEVAQFIKKESQNFDTGRIEEKTGWNNLVSYVDKESEKKLVGGLTKILPGAGFLGEEGTDIPSTNGYTWIIDPLDGTTNFTHGFPPFAVSIGLNYNEETVLGIVHEVMANECFGSFQDAPVWCNNKEVHVAATTSLGRSLIATGFPYDTGDRMDAHLSSIRDLLKQTHGVRRLGSAATDLAYVACGRLDGFFEYNLSPWDVAAGAFLVRQAGGKVTDFDGGSNFLFGRQLCAANAVHNQLLSVVRQNWFQ
ncbi:MAG: inositol monophosphatase [Bacteroidetes bacterium]|nr:inositol monophosphatase [Bacteroidota bacterium]